MGIYLNREDKNFRIGGKNILPFYSERISDWINDTFPWRKTTGTVKLVSKEGGETRAGEIVIPWLGKVRSGRTMGDEMNNGINGLRRKRERERERERERR